MRRVCLLAVGGILLLPTGEVVASDGQKIQVTNFGDADVVAFNHTRHSEDFDCSTCHHQRASGGGHRCGACHLSEPKGPVPSMEQAAHADRVGKCWGCHWSKSAKKKLDCEDCHVGAQ